MVLRQVACAASVFDGYLMKTEIDMGLRTSIVGASKLTEDLLDSVKKVAPTDAPVLIRGPTGSGKELIAQEVHRLSGRDRSGKFIAINCSAIPGDLLESELFGHEKGAFSGAVSAYPGRMRLADKGSLFLDEIGDMPNSLQAKLLRAVQEGVVTPVGSTLDVPIDIRIISATHKDLEHLVSQNKFREDLFFRLNVIPLHVAPLSQRVEEIPELLTFFSAEYATKSPTLFDSYSLKILQQYSWPGNVRELQNFCRRMAALYPSQTIVLRELPRNLLPKGLIELLPDTDQLIEQPMEVDDDFGLQRVLDLTNIEEAADIRNEDLTLKTQLADLERRLIERAVATSDGNIAEAARSLGVKRTTLIEKMARLSITKNAE
jgi:sigma-54 dependent transcriptional regulator, flagellar regulatory protein